MGKDNNGAWIQMAGTVGSGLLGSLISGIFNKRAARKNLEYNKQLMQIQNQYDIDAFNRENARQDYLMRNSAAIQKEALRNAGYSTADPNGTGVQTPAVANQDVPTATTAEFMHAPEVPHFDFVGAYNAFKQNQLLSSQTKYYNELAGRTKSEGEKLNVEMQQLVDSFPLRMDQLRADILQKGSAADLNEAKVAEVGKNIEKLAEDIKLVRFENDYADKYFDYRWKIEKQQYYNLIKEGRIKEASAKLADLGIVVGAGTLENFVGILASAKRGKTLKVLSEGFKELTSQLPKALIEIFSGMTDLFESDDWSWRKFLGEDHDDREGEPAARAADQKQQEEIDEIDYQAKTNYIRQHATPDSEGNIPNEEWDKYAAEFDKLPEAAKKRYRVWQ